ncbi:tyrosine-type recombinase/integrase [Aeromonas schubertii]|uniref:Tyrosine-type recombinase/integrase n=1 Tax=Aeromonas schubertii TaxID=652 RepID=A0ABS7V6D4_9GAMM|nr:tyrosine-type recombinase/integrase [Aeromonas schubertii]MBZ6064665.1 tyrosine-type recombinase/integrase [Aeromonas schubertii]
MTVRKLNDGKPKPWLAELYPQGRGGPRKRKRFHTQGEAKAWELFVLNEHQVKPWLGKEAKERRTLRDLISLWYRLHGQTLKKTKERLAKLDIICNGLGDPLAIEVNTKMWAHYRARRLAGEIDNGWNVGAKKAISVNTVNQELGLIKAVYGELIRLGEWKHPHPLANVRTARVPESTMTYLLDHQVSELLAAAATYPNPDLIKVIKVCLATGARWREAEGLTAQQVTPYRITYLGAETKGKRNRSIPISQELYAELMEDGKSGPLFDPCYLDFGRLLKQTSITLPNGQLTHVLRHTFASQFMLAGGNIIMLQRALGHANIRDTMRYSHLSPDHLDDVVRLNPYDRWRQNGGGV